MVDHTHPKIVNVGALSLDTVVDFVPLSVTEVFKESGCGLIWGLTHSTYQAISSRTIDTFNNKRYTEILLWKVIEKLCRCNGLQFDNDAEC